MGGKVELAQTTAKGVQSGELRKFEQYNVTLNGRRVGYLGFQTGATLCFIERLDPETQRHVQAEAARIAKQEITRTAQPPKVPEKTTDALDDDDINTGGT